MSAILTCISSESKYFDGLATQFLPSLLQTAKFGGVIAIVDYGLTPDQRERLVNMAPAQVRLFRAVRDLPKVILPVLRLRDFAAVLSHSFASHERVVMYDGSDIFFQLPLDELWRKQGMFAAAESNPNLADNPTMKRWEVKGPDSVTSKFYADYPDAPVVNGGMIGGSAAQLAAYCQWAFEQCTSGLFAEAGGADQWVLTWAAIKQIWPIDHANNHWWNYCLAGVNAKTDERGTVCADDGGPVAVVHHNGGAGSNHKWKGNAVAH